MTILISLCNKYFSKYSCHLFVLSQGDCSLELLNETFSSSRTLTHFLLTRYRTTIDKIYLPAVWICSHPSTYQLLQPAQGSVTFSTWANGTTCTLLRMFYLSTSRLIFWLNMFPSGEFPSIPPLVFSSFLFFLSHILKNVLQGKFDHQDSSANVQLYVVFFDKSCFASWCISNHILVKAGELQVFLLYD